MSALNFSDKKKKKKKINKIYRGAGLPEIYNLFIRMQYIISSNHEYVNAGN